MGEFSLTHWLVVLFIIMLLMGPSKLPALSRSMGEAIRDFKKSLREPEIEIEKATQIAKVEDRKLV